MTERKSIHNFRERKDFEKLLERSSLAHHKLWARCSQCGPGEQAIDPDDKDKCVMGHRLAEGRADTADKPSSFKWHAFYDHRKYNLTPDRYDHECPNCRTVFANEC